MTAEKIPFTVYEDINGPDVLTIDLSIITTPLKIDDEVLCPSIFGYVKAKITYAKEHTAHAKTANFIYFLNFCKSEDWDNRPNRWKCSSSGNLKALERLNLQ